MGAQRRRLAGQVPARIQVAGPADRHTIMMQQQIQDGMITRSQLTSLGVSPSELQRMLRRRDVVRLAPGIYVDHTGEPSWQQLAWAAVMHAWPAALCHESVWRQTHPIHVAVALGRKVNPLPGTALHRMTDFEARVNWMAGPPKLWIEHAVLDAAAAAASEHGAIAVLTGVVQRRETTYERLRRTLAGRGRLRRGRWLAAVLEDLASGTNSVLEHGYLVRVERPHGLPSADRQLVSRVGGRRAERDAAYERYGVYVELDGRAFHDNASARDRDLDRDLDAAVLARALTVRLGWGQVFDRACRTARGIGTLLQRGGWTGTPVPCRHCPPSL